MLTQIGQVIAPKTIQKASKGETRSLGERFCKSCSELIPDFIQECVAPDFGSGLWYPWYPLCKPCLEMEEKNASKDRGDSYNDRKEKEFLEMCPPAMLETDASRLSKPLLDKVLNHQLNGRGLILIGKTGMGKTRSMWLLVRDLMVNRGREVRVYEAMELKEVLGQAHNSRYGHKDMINGLCTCDILCIDDLGKEKATDAWEQDLFTIINRRMNYKKPIIITTNFIGESIAQRYIDVHKIEPLVRRIRQFCDGVSFNTYPVN